MVYRVIKAYCNGSIEEITEVLRAIENVSISNSCVEEVDIE